MSNPRTAESICCELGVQFQIAKGDRFSARVGGLETEFFDSPNEALVNFLLTTPRRSIRALRAANSSK